MKTSAWRWIVDNGWTRFVLALTLANLPFWLLGQFYFMSRGLINLDTAVAIVVMMFSGVVGIALLCVAWLADLSLSLAMTFHFGTPLEFIRAAKFGSTLQLGEYLTWANAFAALPFLLCGIALLRLCGRKPANLKAALVVTCVLAAVDALNGSSALSTIGTWKLPLNLAGSPVTTLASIQLHQPNGAPLRPLAGGETVEQLVDVADWAKQHPDRSVLFVVVESLGAPHSPELRAWLDRQLMDMPPADYEARRADVKFRGSTTSGELRQLCSLAGSYREMSTSVGARCLPSRVAQIGWKTIGMHGFSQRMFDRQHWWPLIGLQELHFVDSPLFAENKRCGAAFRGACDGPLILAAVRALQPSKKFVYLLTLNTHLPLSPAPLPAHLPPICALAGVNDDVCELVGALGTVLHKIRTDVDRSGLRPLIVVVGDHAPPFSAPDSRDAFFDDRVPAFAMVPTR